MNKLCVLFAVCVVLASAMESSSVHELSTFVEAETTTMQELEFEQAFLAEMEAEMEWSLKTALKNAGNSVKKGVQKTVAAIKKDVAVVKAAAKKTGDKIKAAAKKTGDKIKASAKKTGDKIKKGLATAGKKIKAGLNKIKEKLFDPNIQIGPALTTDPTFSQSLANDLVKMSSFAYCKASEMDRWTCEDCNRWKSFGHYEHPGGKSTQSIVVGNKAKNYIYVAFRGTMGTLKQWMNNLDFKKVSWPGCSGCQVHQGFKKLFEAIVGPTLANLKKAQAAMPGADVFVTGHSMGAAVGVLFSSYLHEHHPTLAPTQMYNIGCPRVGNSAFSAHSDANMQGHHFRIKNEKDIVPNVPLQNMGFSHTGKLIMCYDGTDNCFVGKRRQENPGVKTGFLQILANIGKALVAHGKYLLYGVGGGKYKCA